MSEQFDDLLAQADAAAQRGDSATATVVLEQAIKLDRSHFDAWVRLASMRRASRNLPGALDAIEAALSLKPIDFTALLLRAYLKEQSGAAEAGELYGYALANAPDDAVELPPTIIRMIDHAHLRYKTYIAEREKALVQAMVSSVEAAPSEIKTRLVRFRSNVLRQTFPFHSEPTDYFYPGLVEREFHDRIDFPWLEDFEAAYADIRHELQALVSDVCAEKTPYVQYEDHLPMRQWAALNRSDDWTALHLLARGQRVEANAARCPLTMAALANLPQPSVPGYGPNAMFSLLAPHTHIPPHTGVANTRLVCHLPLIIPADCWFRVGSERREWREGEAFVFDDTIEHEAMNGSDAARVVLIADLWHPGLTPIERDGVSALLSVGGRTGQINKGTM